jgi:hypothetical protein
MAGRCRYHVGKRRLVGDDVADSAHTPWSERAGDSLGHHANEILIASIVAIVLLRLKPLPGLLGLTVPLAVFALVLVSWMMLRHHDRRLCEQCVLSMPLNPSEQATRYRRRFWMAHTGSEPRFLVPYIVVLLGSNFATSTPGVLIWALVQLSMVYLILSYSTHRRLQPWCPWCSEGGGGEHVDDPDPVLPNDDRQLV